MKKTLLISFLVGIVVFYLLQKFSIIEGMTGTTGTTTSSPSTSASATSATSTSATTNTETSITLPSASTTPPPVPKPPLSSYKMVASTGAAIPETSAAIIAATTAASKTAASTTTASTIDTNKIEANPIPPPTNTPTNKSAPIGSSPKHGAPISSNRNDFLEENGFLYFDSRGTGTGSGFYSQDVPFFPTEDYWIPPGIMDLYDTPMPLIISDDTNYTTVTPPTAPTTLPQTVTAAPPTAPTAPTALQTPHVTLSLGPILIALALITLMIFLFSR